MTATQPKRLLLEKRLQAVRRARKVPEVTVNRDWVQAQVLGGIARHAALRTSLVFKGGTALQKMFFGENFRFSQDLDFTAIDGAPKGVDLARALDKVCKDVERHIKTVLSDDENAVLTCVRKVEKELHPSQEAFLIRFQMPWQRRAIEYVKLEVTYAEVEPLVLPAALRPLLITYGDVTADVLTYSLEEIVIEKLRASPQTIAARDKREAKNSAVWLKPRCRDFYDLWHIATLRTEIDWARVRDNLDAKCAGRDVSIKSIDDVFIIDVVDRVKEDWEAQLEDFVPDPLPAIEPLLAELRSLLTERLGWP